MTAKVAVIGASGFVGTAVADYFRENGIDVVPFVGSTGNSWALLRRGVTPRVLNVLDKADVERQLAGCTQLVNCLRGADDVMLKGLENLIDAALTHRVQRFVHLSSVAVYGDFPDAAAADEGAPPAAAPGSYGWIKLQQDEMVRKAAQRGLASVVLCPPNIFGPGSYFLVQLLDCLLKGELLLVDAPSVCSTVDVRNLAHACRVALDAAVADGRRLFVTDDETVTWPHLVHRLLAAARLDVDVPTCTAAELARRLPSSSTEKTSLWRSVKHLVSSDVRQALRKDPNIAKLDQGMRGLVAKLGPAFESRMRVAIEGTMRVPREPPRKPPNIRLSAQQLRGVEHSCARAKAELGYRPLHTFGASMDAFERWLRESRGMSAPDWELRKRLFGYR